MRFLLLILCIIIFQSTSYSQGPLVKIWDRTFGGDSLDEFYSIDKTSDGGYILGGTSWSDSSYDKSQHDWYYPPYGSRCDYWVVKTDSVGNKIWDKRFGGIDYDHFRELQQTSDGGYILGGYSWSDSSGDKSQNSWNIIYADYWILKISSSGIKQWDKRFGGYNTDFLTSILQTSDGGYIFGGSSTSGISGDRSKPSRGYEDYWIVKTDQSGNKIWDASFGGSGSDKLNDIYQTNDGGYILAGASNSDSSGEKSQNNWHDSFGFVTWDYWIVKIDSLGNKQWDKRYGGANVTANHPEDNLHNVIQTFDKGYILGGTSYADLSGDKTEHNRDSSIGSSDYWILKVDSVGNKQWDRTLGGTSTDEMEFGNVIQTSDSGYIVSGYSYSPSGGDKSENSLGVSNSWIVKLNSNGVKQWDKTIFTLAAPTFNSKIVQSGIGCFTIANTNAADTGGYKSEFSRAGDFDYWMIKFCDSTLLSSVTDFENNPILNIYPNPSSNKILIDCSLLSSNIEIEISDLQGRKIYHAKENLNNRIQIEIDISTLKSGVYSICINDKKLFFRNKFVKY